MRTLAVGVGALLCGTFLTTAAHAQVPCKPIQGTSPFTGVSRTLPYGALITVYGNNANSSSQGPAGATVTATGQGAYDTSNGSDDILVCVVNNSTLPVQSLDLTSSQNIFGFDGDGIDSYGIATNGMDGSGYGGPNTYYTNVNGGQTAGRVNFIPPIPPNGGTAYFSLENQLTAAQGCTSALTNSLKGATGTGATPPPVGNAPNTVTKFSTTGAAYPNAGIRATFVPQGTDPLTGVAYTRTGAATVCGFVDFEWRQTITHWNPSRLRVNPPCTSPAATNPNPFNDPPACGYAYQTPFTNNPLPTYYNPFQTGQWWSLATNETANQLSFFDAPSDSCLPGGANVSVPVAMGGCGGVDTNGSVTFTTQLVGLQDPSGMITTASAVVPTGIQFTWSSTFNGTAGTIDITSANPSIVFDPGATGGETILSVSQTPTYAGVGVTAINGSNLFGQPSPLLSAVLPESRSAQPGGTVTAFATIINTSTSTLQGCSIAPASTVPANFVYQTTNPTTNALTGNPNTPVSIAGNNGSQSFVIAFTPTGGIAPNDLGFNFSCTGIPPAPINAGLNTLLLSASTTTATPDVVALGATLQNDGIVHVTNGSPPTGVFAVATDNLGSSDTITVATNTGTATLPITVTLCQSNPATGACLQTPSATVSTPINSKATPTFAIFVSASNTVPFNPAVNRIFVTFTDSTNAVRGQTSVAVETQ